MSNPTIDNQFQIALRDGQKGEKFAEHMAELAAQIVNATFKFAHDVKSDYESELVPKRRLGDKNFDETDQARLALGAFSFFMHVLDRHLLHMNSTMMRDAVFNFIFDNLAQQVYANSFKIRMAQAQTLILEQYDRRTAQLAEAPAILSEDLEDKDTVIGRAARAICEEDLGREDRRLNGIVGTHLMRGLENLSLADRMTAMAEVLALPGDLRKSA
jgi:hypothetical protein